MTEIKSGYHVEKQEVDRLVITTLHMQKKRTKELEHGIEYPQNSIGCLLKQGFKVATDEGLLS